MAIAPEKKFVHYLRTLTIRNEGIGLTDGQLLAAYVERHEAAAFEALVRRHAPMVMGVCRRILADHHDAEDAVQATFLVLARKAGAIANRQLLANWLYGVAANIALKLRAVASKQRGRERQLAELPEPAAPPTDGPAREMLALLDVELRRLPEIYRVPIVLCELEGKGHKEAARHLGWPIGTVSGRLSRGRALLAKRLARHGVAVAVVSLAALVETAAVSAAVLKPILEAAPHFAAGCAAHGIVSLRVATLTKGAIHAMLLSKLSFWTGALVAAAVFCALAGTVVSGVIVEAPAKAGQVTLPTGQKTLAAANFAAPAERNILLNPGMEDGDKAPEHWSQGADLEGVEYLWDRDNGYKSKSSLCLHKTANRFFPIAQWYQIVDRQGTKGRLDVSAQVKAEKVTKAIIDVIFLDEKDEVMSHKWAAYIGAKKDSDPPANHDWKEYRGRVELPKTAKKVQIGLQIYGPGKVWFDDVRAEYVE